MAIANSIPASVPANQNRPCMAPNNNEETISDGHENVPTGTL
jgi:hypothetical protein